MATEFRLGGYFIIIKTKNMKSILIRKEMVNAINEEKGISDSLATNVRNIYEGLVKNIAQNKNNIETQMNGVKYKNGTYKCMDFLVNR